MNSFIRSTTTFSVVGLVDEGVNCVVIRIIGATGATLCGAEPPLPVDGATADERLSAVNDVGEGKRLGLLPSILPRRSDCIGSGGVLSEEPMALCFLWLLERP